MVKNKWRIYISIVFISFCQSLQFTISPVLRQIQIHYADVDVSMIQMLVSIPSFLAMFIAVAAGWLVVKVNMKKLLIYGSLITGITGFIPFLHDSFMLLFISRALLGVGYGLNMALNTTVVAYHFEGKERVFAMGFQGASVGTGMMLSMLLGGIVGSYNYQNIYYIHVLGLIAALVVWRLLPDTGKAAAEVSEKIQLNRKVFYISFLVMIQFVFLISVSTNLAMHLSGKLTGNASVAGLLTGIYSGVQIAAGPLTGYMVGYTKKYTLAVAMLNFSLGAFLLALFPSELSILVIGVIFCGISQGVIGPYAFCEAAEAVRPIAVTMASACISVAICVGQLISPPVLNGLSRLIYGSITTAHVYTLGAAVVMLIAVAVIAKEKHALS
jgi:Arabinose efflux permease